MTSIPVDQANAKQCVRALVALSMPCSEDLKGLVVKHWDKCIGGCRGTGRVWEGV